MFHGGLLKFFTNDFSERHGYFFALPYFAYMKVVGVHRYFKEKPLVMKTYQYVLRSHSISILFFASIIFGSVTVDAKTVYRDIDSSYLPLTIAEIQLDNLGLAKVGGGLLVCYGRLLLYDRLGKIVGFGQNESITKLVSIKHLDLGLSRIKSGDLYQVNEGTFRLHKLKCDEKSGVLYATHEYFDGAPQFRLSQIPLRRSFPFKLESTDGWEPLFKSSNFKYKNYVGAAGGGGLTINNDGTVLFAIGDYNLDGVLNKNSVNSSGYIAAQDVKSSYGKVYSFNPKTKIISLYSVGHRNPQSISQSESGAVYMSEHGPQGGDKLIKLESGKNYGWPFFTYGVDYGVYKWPHPFRSKGYEPPMYSFVPSIGISSVNQIINFNDRWNGDLLITSLKAQTLFRVKLLGGSVQYVEPIYIGERMRDVAMYKKSIYIWTDSGKLLVLSVNKSKLRAGETQQAVKYAKLDKCLACHHLGVTNETHLAPTLSGLLGRPMGSDEGYNRRYSTAAKSMQNKKWSEDNIKEFLRNPNSIIPGTVMPTVPLTEKEINEIVHVIKGL